MRGAVLLTLGRTRQSGRTRNNASISQLTQVCDFFFPHGTKIAYDFGTDARSGVCEDARTH